MPSWLGPRPVRLAFLARAADWQTLVNQEDWQRLVVTERRPFGLFTASADPHDELDSWQSFADYCVNYELMLVASWGENSTLLDDVFDMSAILRAVEGLLTAEPLTSWHDHEPFMEAFDFFLRGIGSDLRRDDGEPTAWERFALVIGNRDWYDHLCRAVSHLAS